MLADVLSGDTNAKNSLATLMNQLEYTNLQAKVNSSENDDDNNYFQWDQNLSEGGSKAKYLIWKVTSELASLCILCNTTKEVNPYYLF